ncbi:site-specific integrase [Massilia sp. TWP1-3-3]|uniref:site-specific integrase n=1 Tax=Massilia sp. TWP1-3-3 TaxID=2804573 RepID=UPI003CE95331
MYSHNPDLLWFQQDCDSGPGHQLKKDGQAAGPGALASAGSAAVRFPGDAAAANPLQIGDTRFDKNRPFKTASSSVRRHILRPSSLPAQGNFMATINERTRTNRPNAWQVSIRVKGEKPIIGTFESKALAEEFVRRVEPPLRKKQAKLAASLKMSEGKPAPRVDFYAEDLEEVLTKFAESSACTLRHRKTLPTVIKSVGRVRICDARTPWVRSYVQRMSKCVTRRKTTFSYETLKVHLAVMKAACVWHAENLGVDDPSLHFHGRKCFPKGWDKGRDRRLEAGEEAALMGAIRSIRKPSRYHWRLLFRLALATGARLQELVLSEWREMVLDDQVWTIPAEHSKTDEARSVTLSTAARRIVRLLRALASAGSERIFHTLGKPDSVSACFHKLTLKAGVQDFRFHDLRHESITRMVLYSEAKFRVIMAMVGHKRESMTMRYTNLRPHELVGVLG